MAAIGLFEADQGGDEGPAGVLAFNPYNKASVRAAQRAIQQQHGVDLGPLLPRVPWWSRLWQRNGAN